MINNLNLAAGWDDFFAAELTQPYMVDLRSFLKHQKNQGKVVLPPSKHIFEAFRHTSFSAVKVVILGQDPYHQIGQAHGLSFSVLAQVKAPPSLQNIFKELAADLGIVRRQNTLLDWSQQGVLLLNSVLTVEAHRAGSHREQGWELFTDKVVSRLNDERQNLVFILWGSYAQKKGRVIDSNKHFIIKSPHPSPLSAHNGFFGSCPFSRCNAYLSAKSQSIIRW